MLNNKNTPVASSEATPVASAEVPTAPTWAAPPTLEAPTWAAPPTLVQELALDARHLVKSFDDLRALKGVSFDVRVGEVFGLLGPNGAGKSTLVKMVYGHVQPNSGDLYILGMNVRSSSREIRGRLGVVPQDEGLDVELTVLENLMVFASFFEVSEGVARARAYDLLKMMRLDEYTHEPVANLSSGYRRRLAIARAMVNHPEILILDEPTVGLDSQVRLWIWDFLKKVKDQAKTIILTTHYMEEAELLCDRIAIVDKGQALAVGSPQDLISVHLGPQMAEFEVAGTEMSYYLNRIRERRFKFFTVGSHIYVPFQAESDANELLTIVNSRRIAIRRTTLSDVFLHLAGHDLREEPT
ncbi:MAG: ABC transporter ATP-binding protein [Bdellovibrio sp.]|nr:MAG: ABC transporter ATP-binding protein [Bdellovibrio sp.]